jgi:hypothetical protein
MDTIADAPPPPPLRILVGDYLYITSAEALRRLVGWMALADEILENSSLEVRLAEISKLPSKPDSFHPKTWRIIASSVDLPAILYLPRPWQNGALESLDRICADGVDVASLFDDVHG